MGCVLAEIKYQEGHIKRRVKEEEDYLACIFHSTVMIFHRTVLLGKLQQPVRQDTNREGGGVFFCGTIYT